MRSEHVVWRFVKTFLVCGVCFGTVGYLEDVWTGGGSVERAFERGVFMGLFMAGFLTIMQLAYTRRARLSQVPRVRQSATLTLPGGVPETTDTVRQALLRLGARDLQQRDDSDNVLVARMPMTWRSFGETIRVTFVPLDAGATRADIESSPRLKTTLADYGKNLQNIERIQELLRSAARS